MASTLYNERSDKAAEDIDAVRCRPAFTILIHPAYRAKDADSVAPVGMLFLAGHGRFQKITALVRPDLDIAKIADNIPA